MIDLYSSDDHQMVFLEYPCLRRIMTQTGLGMVLQLIWKNIFVEVQWTHRIWDRKFKLVFTGFPDVSLCFFQSWKLGIICSVGHSRVCQCKTEDSTQASVVVGLPVLSWKKMGSISPAWKCAMCIRCGAPQLAKFCFMSRLNDWVRGPRVN